ncbi:MAG: coproporphyrinogen dehydrogenase HemZ [Eubacteriales bacterium]|nr:coproporphyrinogen dehydrogenase HemZ [Eubacteriales bacterium]
MIYIDIDNDIFYDDAIVLVRSFYPRTEVSAYKKDAEIGDDDKVIEVKTPDTENLSKKEMHEVFKESFYKELQKMTRKSLPWGYLTGVRPSKIAYTMLEEGAKREDIIKEFTDKHFACGNKAELALCVAETERDILRKIDYKNGYSLYIGIPFCPSICLYCSFSSYSLGAYKDYVEQYLDALIKEMEFVSRSMKDRRLDTVYFGGGTPTTLSASQLDRLLTELERLFDIDNCRELTVEAGRPDSITVDKLKVLKEHNVGRISINPQTMNQKTLDLIGRKHTVQHIKEVFSMARDEGFNNINMDIILGLPGEGVDEVRHTLDEITAMKPESLTVHSLAIKRAAALNIWRDQYVNLTIDNTEEIVRMTEETSKNLNMQPYYMYRQKNMAGNFENVGYAIKGLECIYNILIMEEKQTIIACGAGASSKIVFHGESDKDHSVRIERIENVKDVKSYVERIDEMIQRKEEFFRNNWR